MAKCLSNCAACDLPTTSTLMGSCVAADGVAAVALLKRTCARGQGLTFTARDASQGLDSSEAGCTQVRKPPGWPRSWANFSFL